MEYYAIVIRDNEISESAFKRLKESTPIHINRRDAVTPRSVRTLLHNHDLRWNYPWRGEQLDIETGLIKSAYLTKEPKRRIACALSHYFLWKKCLELNEPIVILEHDAMFTNKIDFDIMDTKYDIVGINDPRRATRLSQVYHGEIQRQGRNICQVPWIDNQQIPQGLAGNSAYVMKPSGAKKMVGLAKTYGLWPNDALMCRQLIPSIGVTKKYYTKVQGTESTTT